MTQKLKLYQDLKTAERGRRIKTYLEGGPSNKLTQQQLSTMRQYYEHLVSASRSEETINTTLHKLKKFGEFVHKPYEEVTAEDFTKFLVHLNEQKAKLNYVNGFKLVLRVFYKHLLGLPDNNDPMLHHLKIKRAGPVKSASDCLTQDEIKQLINSTDNYRDRFMLHGLYESGLRKSEFMNLKLKDVKLHSNHAEILSVNGKTGYRQMKIPLMSSFPDLVSLLNHHPHKDNPESPLFIDLQHPDKGLGPYGLNDALRKYQNRAGLKKKVHPHIFRHTRMTHLAEQGLTEIDLRLFAGWTPSSPMAAHYVHSQGKHVENKLKAHKGIEVDGAEEKVQERKLEPVKCMRCGLLNSTGTRYCRDCGSIVDLKTALELQDATRFSSDVIERTYKKKGGITRELVKEVLKEMIANGEI